MSDDLVEMQARISIKRSGSRHRHQRIAPLIHDALQYRGVGGDTGLRTAYRQIGLAHRVGGKSIESAFVVNGQATSRVGGGVPPNKGWGTGRTAAGAIAGDAGHAVVDSASVRGLGMDRAQAGYSAEDASDE